MQTTQEISTTQTTQDNKKTLYVWERLSNIYGIRFVQEHGATPNYDWVRKIEAFSIDEINQGIENLLNENTRYMINLSHFIGLIKMGNGDTEEQRIQKANARGVGNLLALQTLKKQTLKTRVGKCSEIAMKIEKMGKIGDFSEAEKMWGLTH